MSEVKRTAGHCPFVRDPNSLRRPTVYRPSVSLPTPAGKTQRLAHNGFAYQLGVLLADGRPRKLTAEETTPVQNQPKTKTEVDRLPGVEENAGCVRRRDHALPLRRVRELPDADVIQYGGTDATLASRRRSDGQRADVACLAAQRSPV